MARTVQDFRLNTRSARLKLRIKREPYWKDLQQGLAIGYRRGAGTWLGRYWDTTTRKYKHESFGPADDAVDSAVTFEQAQEAIRAWYKDLKRGKADYTVKESLDAYIQYLTENKSEDSVYEHSLRIEKYCRSLDHYRVNDLTSEIIADWRRKLIDWPDIQNLDSEQAETLRKKKDTANRILTILKAALNQSFHNVPGIISDAEWKKVRPYPQVGESRKVFLTEAQSQRLINTAQGALKNLIIAGLLTGCRYGELIGARVQHFDGETFEVTGKTGGRDVILDDAGINFFKQICTGKNPDERIFTRDDGKPWQKSQQQRPFAAAVKRAKLPAATVFYSLRHTYASQRLLAGINHQILAENMGTSIRMLEKHYGKFMRGDRRAMMNSTASNLELPESNVVAL